MKKCKLCKAEFRGRKDKMYCSISCKSEYNSRLNEATSIATKRIDKILHRNRSILLEIIGKNVKQIKVTRDLLDAKGFKWGFHTHTHVNNNGKTVSYLYDHSWLLFSDQEVLITKIKSRNEKITPP